MFDTRLRSPCSVYLTHHHGTVNVCESVSWRALANYDYNIGDDHGGGYDNDCHDDGDDHDNDHYDDVDDDDKDRSVNCRSGCYTDVGSMTAATVMRMAFGGDAEDDHDDSDVQRSLFCQSGDEEEGCDDGQHVDKDEFE